MTDIVYDHPKILAFSKMLADGTCSRETAGVIPSAQIAKSIDTYIESQVQDQDRGRLDPSGISGCTARLIKNQDRQFRELRQMQANSEFREARAKSTAV